MAMAAVGLCVAAFAGGAQAQEVKTEPAAAPRPERPVRPDVMSWDINADGKVSYEEFKAGSEIQLKARFDMLDADKDGSVTAEEAQRARREMGERMRRRAGGDGDQPRQRREGAAKPGAEVKAEKAE